MRQSRQSTRESESLRIASAFPSPTRGLARVAYGLAEWDARVRPRLANALAQFAAQDLQRAYQQGRRRNSWSLPADEEVPEPLVAAGCAWQAAVLDSYRDKYQTRPYRFLFQMPRGGVGVVWFQDLLQCLSHTGLACATVQARDTDLVQIWEAFQPNVFVTMDLPHVLQGLPLDYIEAYKHRRGCLRLFTPLNTHRFPRLGLSAGDRWRLELARAGRTADAFFSMMVPEYFDYFFREWRAAGFAYLPLPNACNPFRHFPVRGRKAYDYSVLTSFSADRVQSLRRYALGICAQHPGVWAGTGWRFGCGPVAAQDLPAFYARTRVALAPLLDFLMRWPAEVTERAFSAVACGAFQITNRTPVTGRFFTEEEIVCADTPQAFADMHRYYVVRPDERTAIVLKGMQRVYREHTYFHRIDRLIDFLDQSGSLF